MKKTMFLVMVVAGIVMLGSCGGGKQQGGTDDTDSVEAGNLVPRDNTIYGLCSGGTAMNTLEMITDNGDTLTLSLEKAQEAGKVFGGLQVADRLAVIADKDRKEAQIVINLNTLMGDWVMPDPIDGSAEIGIRIKEGGVAESIDQSTITYRTWRLSRGKLEIVMVREGGSEEEETYLYDIVKLGADSLVYKDGDETFEYSRQKPKEEYGKDVQLEDAQSEFFL